MEKGLVGWRGEKKRGNQEVNGKEKEFIAVVDWMNCEFAD